MPENILTNRRLATTLRTEDYGLFGPGSPAWKVWTSPTILLGLQRAVALQFLNPFFTAAQHEAQLLYRQPGYFFDGTLGFLLTGIIGDSKTAVHTSNYIMEIHSHATGIEPLTGKRYHANSPQAQLYTHISGWESMLKCYETFGPGPLDPADEEQYWSQCAEAAALFTCKPADVPTSRTGVREYYAALRPHLCLTENARSGFFQQLRTTGSSASIRLRLVSRLAAPATVATMPAWVRKLLGLEHSIVVDRTSVASMRLGMRAIARSPRATWLAVGLIAPISGAILKQHFLGHIPENPSVVSLADVPDQRNRSVRMAVVGEVADK